MDNVDRKIMNIIQENAKISNIDIARNLGMAPSSILERIRRLERRGYVKSYEARLDHRKLGLNLTAFIWLDTDEKIGVSEVGAKLIDFPEIQEVHDVSGEYCYLLKVRVADTDALADLMTRIGQLPLVRKSDTTLVLKTEKESCRLFIPEEL